MMLTFGPAGENGEYLGVAYEGVKLLPTIGSYFTPIANFLWGFDVPELLAYPFTALGAVGSAMGLTQGFIDQGIATANTVATFTGMSAFGRCCCWRCSKLSLQAGCFGILESRKE